METTEKVLVCLDFSQADTTLIAYADFLTDLMPIKEITFFHVEKEMDLPDELQRILAAEEQSFDDFLLAKMKESVTKILAEKKNDYQVHYVLKKGAPMEQVVKYAHVEDTDLVLIGRKNKSEGSGILLTRLARKIHCSFIIVPEETELFLDDILVCADFSEWSKRALECAVEISSHDERTAVYCQHIYEVPHGYHKIGKSFTEFAKIMKKHALRRYQEFIKNIDKKGVTVAPIITLHKHGNDTSIIKDTASSVGANLVILGSKGKTFTSSIFLGSFAEKLVREDFKMPLMIVKAKNETIGVIKALQMI